ncbi:sigma-70 family RNA polymerase sigma factor [Aeromicrobium sp. Leaf272]|uniref:sigma-70 family RNA polymerase sigma factor n=1 Tax=Aeromicrobium sp. Leaf272 TaxID=1736317 RepID=UPI00351782D7
MREALAAGGCFTADTLDDGIGSAALTEDGYARVDAWLTVRSLRTTLTDDERRLLAWRFVDELPQREIATRLGISQMQVSRRLSTLLARLRREVGDVAA